MAEDAPLVSVVLSTYNCVEYLRESVASVLSQTYRNWELIVVDDGSTDATAAWLDALSHPQVRAIVLDHSGNPGRVRNAGLADARGSWVAFFDADDVWRPDKLAVQVADLRARPGCAWGYTGFGVIDAQGRQQSFPPGAAFKPFAGTILDKLIAREATIGTSCVIADLKLLRDLGGFDESLVIWEAWDLLIRLGARSPAAVVAAPVVDIRFHGSSFTKGRPDEHGYRIRMYEKVLVLPEARKWRSLARRQILVAALTWASWFRRAGRPADAFRMLLANIKTLGRYPAWWLALVKTVLLRRLVPGARRRPANIPRL